MQQTSWDSPLPELHCGSWGGRLDWGPSRRRFAATALREDFLWQRVDEQLPLYRLLEGDALAWRNSSAAVRISSATAAWPWRLSATDIGCYFDDALHELLGVADSRWQSLYHFTLGRALWNERLSTLPAYPELPLPPN